MANIVMDYSLINDAYFKAYCPIPFNYNMDEIRPYYHIAEKLWVVDVLGTPLYNELLQQVNDNEVTELNSTLLLKIYPYLAICVCLEALPFIAYHFTEVGITKGKSDNSDSVSINDVNFISRTLRTQAELLKKYLKKFLNDNASLYPLYFGDGNSCDCKCEKGDEWIWNYYFNPGINKYDLERMYLRCMIQKDKPNPDLQLWGTPRRPIDII